MKTTEHDFDRSPRPWEIVVRRLQGNGAVSEFVVRAPSRGALRQRLRAILEMAARERGSGVWSDVDPEIHLDGRFVTRLTPHDDVARLVEDVLARLAAA